MRISLAEALFLPPETLMSNDAGTSDLQNLMSIWNSSIVVICSIAVNKTLESLSPWTHSYPGVRTQASHYCVIFSPRYNDLKLYHFQNLCPTCLQKNLPLTSQPTNPFKKPKPNQNKPNQNKTKQKEGKKTEAWMAGKMAQQRRALAALQRTRVWVSAHTWWLEIIWNSSFRRAEALFLLPWSPGTQVLYIHIRKQIIHTYKIE